MCSHAALGMRSGRWLCVVVFAAVAGWAAVAAAQSPAVVRVEEDWELVVATPDAGSTGPQVTCTISPRPDLAGLYGTFEINHRSLPSFQPGGLQVQTWNGEQPVAQSPGPASTVMSTAGETVRWTQVMRLAEGRVVFEVVNGTSTTWGSFGGQGYLKLSVPTSLTNLNGYSPEVSVRNSGVGFAGNRVQSLVLKRVRYQLSNGMVLEDGTARVVHQP